MLTFPIPKNNPSSEPGFINPTGPELTSSVILDLASAKINELERRRLQIDAQTSDQDAKVFMMEFRLDEPTTSSLTALTLNAASHDIREYFDAEIKKRFITSPIDLGNILGTFDAQGWKTIVTPKYVGVVRGQLVDMVYLYEIPVNSASINSINLARTAAEPTSILNNVDSTMDQLKTANPHLPVEIFDDWQNHWAYDINGQLVLINPFRDTTS